MEKDKLLFTALLSVLFLIPISFAAPPFIQASPSQNLIIEFPPIQFYTANQNITLDFHVFNSTGHPLTNATTTCFFHLYDMNGNAVIEGRTPTTFDSVSAFDWSIKLTDKNTSRLGEYTYIFQCNNTIAGGFISNSFLTVNDQNKYLYGDVGATNYAMAMIFGLLIVAFFLIYMSDKFNMEGESFIKAITSLGISLIFKLSAFGIMIYDLLLLREVIPTPVTSYTSLYDPMLQMLMYGVGILFFILYFINSIVTLAYNFNIQKQNKIRERKYG